MKHLWRFYVAFVLLVMFSILWLKIPKPLKSPKVYSVKIKLNEDFELINRLKRIQSKRNGKLNILLIGQWKSGSLYLAQLLTMYPNTFFVKDPVDSLNAEAMLEIANLFQCNIPQENSTSPSDINADLCSKSNINIIKNISFRLKAITLQPLLEYDPKLKVLLMVRDPRAIWNSRSNTIDTGCAEGPYCQNLDDFCPDLTEELDIVLKVSNGYQGRIKIIRYEDLVQNNVPTIKKVFQYFNDTIDEKIVTKLVKSYQRGLKAMKIQRELGITHQWINPHQNIRKWLKQLPIETSKIISEKCSKVIKMLGYPPSRNGTLNSMVAEANEEIQKILLT